MALEQQQQHDQEQVDIDVERLGEIGFEIDCACSDWSLARHPELLAAFTLNNVVPLSTIIKLPALQDFEPTVKEAAQALTLVDLVFLSVDQEQLSVSRLKPIPDDVCQTDWSLFSFYAENLPFHKATTSTAEIRSFLTSLLSTTIQTVRFPLLYDSTSQDDTTTTRKQPEQDPSLAGLTKTQKQRERKNRMPQGGGPYKGFCFFVVGDDQAAAQLVTTWAWNRVLSVPVPVREEQDTSTSLRSGFRSLPIKQWNELKAEYLSYARTLKKLAEEDDEQHSQRYESHGWNNSRQKGLQPQREQDEERVDWKASQSSYWASVAAEEEAQTRATYPKDCVVQLNHVHPDTTRFTIKTLVQDMIKQGGAGKGERVRWINYSNGSTRAQIQCSTPGAAVAVKLLLLDSNRCMSTPEANTVDKLSQGDGQMDALKATILEGEEERAFWKSVPVRGERTFAS